MYRDLRLVVALLVTTACNAPQVLLIEDAGPSNPSLTDAGLLGAGLPDAGAIGPGVTTVAGNDGFHDGTGGPNGTAEFSLPTGVAVDAQGNVYVGDLINNRVRRIDPAGNVTTVAGNGTAGDVDGTGGPNGTAEFNNPAGVAVDADGNVYVADFWNNRIRRVDASGHVTTVAGNGTEGFADGTGGRNGQAEFDDPIAVALDGHGNLYVADLGNWRIRKVDPAGNVTTLAGDGQLGHADGPCAEAEFSYPSAIATDTQGNVYVAEAENGNRVRRIDPSCQVTTVAGNGIDGWADGTGGANGTAEFSYPSGIAVDAAGSIYVGDERNNRVRRIDTAGNVTTVAGDGVGAPSWGAWADGAGGPNGPAEFFYPCGIAFDSKGSLYVGDSRNNRIRKIDPAGNVTTLAGNGGGNFVFGGYSDGTGGPDGTAQFNLPEGIARSPDGTLYVADSRNNRIRKIDLAGNVTTLAGNGLPGLQAGAGGPNGTAEFGMPQGVATDDQGNVYVADRSAIRKIDPAGNVITLAGTAASGYADGPGAAAQFDAPIGIAVDGNGNVYVSEFVGNRVRKIDPAGNVSTLAGNGAGAGTAPWTYPQGTYSADGTGGAHGTAEFNEPWGLAVDTRGNVYVGDNANNQIRKIDPAGNVTTLAGNGTPGWADGTGGREGTAEFKGPAGIAVDVDGNVYVADSANRCVRKIDASGNVTTLAGNGTLGDVDGTLGHDGTTEFAGPVGVAAGPHGEVVVVDENNNRIRLIRP